MGVLQALEAIKVLTAKFKRPYEDSIMGNDNADEAVKPTMLMFSAYSNPQFRTVRLRSRRSNCAVCSAESTITNQSLTSGSLDYIAFCGLTAPINILPSQYRISASDFARLPTDGSNVLIDVRDKTQYDICALRGSLNVPWTGSADTWLEKALNQGAFAIDGTQKYIVCRFGNDSQLAAKAIMDRMSGMIDVKDIKGGFKSWRDEVDSDWPDY
jgi:adenylyltransferase/sulfurtransferase